MSISLQNLVVVYREDSDASYEFAAYYADTHNLDYLQLIPVPCSSDEILDSYAEFKEQIEDPLKEMLSFEYTGIDATVILVGFGVPGGFRDGGDIIATTSRLSRINHTFDKGMSNPLFARQKFKKFDVEDSQTALIVSRIDAPTLEDAKLIVNNIIRVSRTGVANGKLFFDPFGVPVDSDEEAYQDELFDFEINLQPVLGIKSYRTTFWDDATDVVIPRLKDDSFMWAWKADRGGYSFFLDKTTSRVFLYNGDTDGGETVRDPGERRWPMLAMASGYASTAGAMSDPLPEGLLRPKPFFDALFRGGTIGEAFLSSVPNLDWTVSLFGDPLLLVRFPSAGIRLDGYTERSGFEVMGKNLQSSISYYFMREKSAIDAYNIILTSKNLSVLRDILKPFAILGNAITSKTKGQFVRLVEEFSRFPRGNESLPTYLDRLDLQISRVFTTISANVVMPGSLRLPVGSWILEDTVRRPTSSFSVYHFQLQLSVNEDFTELIDTGISYQSLDELSLNADSSRRLSGWFFEKDSNQFSAMTARGVSSSFTGRRVKYIAGESEYFAARQVYWIRMRQVNEFGEIGDWQTYKQVVGT